MLPSVRKLLNERFALRRLDSRRILAESKQRDVDRSLLSEDSTQEEPIDLSKLNTIKFLNDLNRLAESIFDKSTYRLRALNTLMDTIFK
jgi:hypothetical protein